MKFLSAQLYYCATNILELKMDNPPSGKEDNGVNESASRKRVHSESSGSSSESDSDVEMENGHDTDTEPPLSDKSARHKSRKRARQVSDMQFEFLSQQVAFLTQLVTQSQTTQLQTSDLQVSQSDHHILTDTSQNKNSGMASGISLQPPKTVVDKNVLQLSDFTTTVKDPLHPKSNDTFVAKLSDLQRFKCVDWNAIRFAETQKKYATTPGFVELTINDELRRFESPLNEDYRLHLLERTFAALTNAVLSQKEELRNTLQGLIDWSSDSTTSLTPSALFEKLEQAFSKQSAYTKVSDDILQIICGRRSDFVHLRRDSLLKQIPDEFHHGALQRIPPSVDFLFDSQPLNDYLQKIGGAEKLSIASRSTQQPTPSRTNQQRSAFNEFPKASTSKQSNEFFRPNTTSKKGKSNQAKSSGGNKSFKNKRDQKRKQTRSNSPQSKYRGRRA